MLPNKVTETSAPPSNYATQVHAIRLNDESTIKALYTQNYRQAERYILQNSGSIDEAKDIYQEAFIAVWRNIQLDKFHPENEASLQRYLLQVTKNKWLDHLRSARHRLTVPLHTEDAAEEIAQSPVEQLEKLNSIKLHFKQLGKICREVLTRFYYHRESLRTISSAQNWTEATARNNKYRCIQQLKQLIQNNNIRDEHR